MELLTGKAYEDFLADYNDCRIMDLIDKGELCIDEFYRDKIGNEVYHFGYAFYNEPGTEYYAILVCRELLDVKMVSESLIIGVFENKDPYLTKLPLTKFKRLADDWMMDNLDFL